MSFKSSRRNPIRDLVEMDAVFAENRSTGLVDATVTLHINPGEIDLDDGYTIRVLFSSAYLVLEPDNLTPDIDSYYGLRVKPESVTTSAQYNEHATRSLGRTSSVAAEAEATMALPGPSGKAVQKTAAGNNYNSEYSVERSCEKVITHFNVAYDLNDRWKISEADGKALEGTYLKKQRICALAMPTGKPNRVGGTIHLMVRRKDIEVSIDDKAVPESQGFFKFGRNKKAVLDALVASRLRALCEQKSEATITFATVDAEHEG